MADGAEDASSLEFRPYDRAWEDFPLGTFVRTRGMTVTETHIVNWANLAGDWLPLHVDHHVSATTPFGSVIAHGPLTIALSLGLVIQSGFFGDSVIAWLGLDEVRLPRPVLPGDTISVGAEVVEHVVTSKPHRGRISLSYDVRNQRDEVVLTFRSGFLMYRRDVPDAKPSGETG
ncbi:MAG: MaoC/PaaZ C-terminal domain-containing protein [Nitriliruptoraceae bacterium]